ncbi:MAG: hypothetical protein PWQ91_1538 [Eubacteriales bacterium]|nr:hypothetical protein [Eubacteriales bacterium]
MRQKVLVVAENPAIRLLIKNKFEKAADLLFSYQVVEAEDAGTARELAEREEVDAIICDLDVPPGGGLFLCQQLKEVPALAGIPVVVLGERSGREERIAAYSAGAVAFVAKPFAVNELYYRVRALLQMRTALFTGKEMEAVTTFLQREDLEPAEALARLLQVLCPGSPFYIWHKSQEDLSLIFPQNAAGETPGSLSPESCRIEGWVIFSWSREEGEYIAAVNSRGMGAGKREFLRWLLSLRG